METLATSIIITLQLAILTMLFILHNPPAPVKTKPKPKAKPKPKIKKVPSESSSDGGNFFTRQNDVKLRPDTGLNDEILTPPELAKVMIADTLVIAKKVGAGIKWLDGFKNTGVFYNNYPEGADKDYCEIIEDKDFFKYSDEYDVICGNPPFSLLSSKAKYGFKGIWETCATLHKPKVISFITGSISISPQLINRMDGWGYKLVKIHQFKVQKWVPSYYTIWVRTEGWDEINGVGSATQFTTDNQMYQWVETDDRYHEFWEMSKASKE